MRRMAVTAAIALAFAAVSPATASAWNQYPCTSGRLNAADFALGPPGPDIAFPGEVDCGVSMFGSQFVVAVFEADRDYGYYHHDLLHDYLFKGDKTTFDVNGRFMMRDKLVNTGLCIMPDPNTRLSCVVFSPTTMNVKPMSTSDPMVTKAVREADSTDTEPNCGTCWRVP